MLCYIKIIVNKNTFLYFIKVEFKSFFIKKINKYKIIKNIDICKILFLIYLSRFKN